MALWACASALVPAAQWSHTGSAHSCLALGCHCRKRGAAKNCQGLLINHLLQLMRKRQLTEGDGKGWSGKISHFRRALEKRSDVMKMSHS